MKKTQVTGSETTHSGRPLLRRRDLIVFAVVILLALLLKLTPRLWLSQSGKILARLSFDNRLLCEFDPAQLAPRTYSLEELLELSSASLPGADEHPGERPEYHPEERPGLWPEDPPEGRPENPPENPPEERPENHPEERPENRLEERPENRPENRLEERPVNRPGLRAELPPMFIGIEADGGVRVAASDCPDQYCVRRGVCRKAGDFAACVPNKVILTLLPAGDHESEDADSGIDMVVGDPAPPGEP